MLTTHLVPADLQPRQVKKDTLGHLLSSEIAWLGRLFAANVPTREIIKLSGTTENTICRQRRAWEAAEKAAGRETPYRPTPNYNRWPDAEKRRAAILKLIKARVPSKRIVQLIGASHGLVADVRRRMRKPLYAPSVRRTDDSVRRRIKQLIVEQHPRTVIERVTGIGPKVIGKCGSELTSLAIKTGKQPPKCRCGRAALHSGTCWVTDALKRRDLDHSKAIEAAVPRWPEPATRDDAKAELAADVLAGLVLDSEIPAAGPRYANASSNKWNSKFGPRSIDAPITEDGFTLSDVLPDPDSLVSMEERMDAKWAAEREAKIMAIAQPVMRPAKAIEAAPIAAEVPPTAPVAKPALNGLPMNDLLADLRRAIVAGTGLSLRGDQVRALITTNFVEWLAPHLSKELQANLSPSPG